MGEIRYIWIVDVVRACFFIALIPVFFAVEIVYELWRAFCEKIAFSFLASPERVELRRLKDLCGEWRKAPDWSSSDREHRAYIQSAIENQRALCAAFHLCSFRMWLACR